MIPLVVIPVAGGLGSTFRQVLDSAFTLLRFEAPDTGTGSGYCLFPGMAITSKISIGFVMPLLIAASMLLCFIVSIPLHSIFGMNSTSVRRLYGSIKRRLSQLPLAPAAWVVSATSSDDHTEPPPSVPPTDPAAESLPSQRSMGKRVAVGLTTQASAKGSAMELESVPSQLGMPVTGQEEEETATVKRSERVLPFGRGNTTKARTRSMSAGDIPSEPQTHTLTRSRVGSQPILPLPSSHTPFSTKSTISSALSRITFKRLSLTLSTRPVPLRPVLSLPHRIKGAALNWFLFTYTSALSATLKLLLCIPLTGTNNTYLFLDANRMCASEWLAPLYTVLVCMLGFALVLPLLTLYLHRHISSSRHTGIYRILTDPYRLECYWWECVLLVQRLLLSVFNTFLAHAPVVRLLLAGLVCLTAATLHLLFRPIHDPGTQRTQTVFQFSLLALILVNLSVAQTVENAQESAFAPVDPYDAVSTTVQQSVVVAFVYVVPILALVARFGVAAIGLPVYQLGTAVTG